MFAEAKALKKAQPAFIIIDNFTPMKVNPRKKHVRLAGIVKPENNMVERLHGTVRQRNKVMRGLDHEDSAQTMLDGMRIYYNFIRPHMALNGKTPAEEANIDLKLGKNKWLSLIKRMEGSQLFSLSGSL